MLNNIINLLRKTSPENLFNMMLNNNPQFRNFVEINKGKSPEQIASDYNIDLAKIEQLLKKGN